jgi:hypothetical protein
LDITNRPLARGLSFAEAKRRLLRFGMMFYHEAYVTSEAIPKPALGVPERD